jgi:hypothetical protein
VSAFDEKAGHRDRVKRGADKPPHPLVVENIPAELRPLKLWGLWRYDRRDGEWTKPPVDPATMRVGDKLKITGKYTLDEVLAARASGRGEADGVCVCLPVELPAEQDVPVLCVIDQDDCRDPETGEIAEWARAIIDRFNSYTEVSPSGTGVKVFLLARKPGLRCKTGNVEVYNVKKMLTVTGLRLDGCPVTVEQRQDVLTAFYNETFPPDAVKLGGVEPPPPPELADVELLAVAFAAKNGAKVKALFFGDTSAYPSHSEADLALCSHLAFYFVNPEGIDRAFQQSALMRRKWLRDDYRKMTIGRALEGRTEFYDPTRRRRKVTVTFTTAGGAPTGEGGKGVGGGRSTPPEGGRAASRDLPEIVIGTDEYRVNSEAAESLGAHPGTYQRGGLLVEVTRQAAEDDQDRQAVRRPAGAPVIRPLTKALVRERLTQTARFVRVVTAREGEERRPAPPPGWCVSAVFDHGRWPKVRHLEAVVSHPVWLPDGSILTEPGFHPGTGLLLWTPKGLEVAVPDRPIPDDVRAALVLLLDTVRDFPFETEAHKAAWVAALLTPLAWWAFEGPAPLFLIDANVRAAGKGLLADVIALIVLGHRFPVMSYTPDRDELRKRITSLAAEGERLVLLDNLAGAVGNDVLDGALTAETWKDRLLSVNKVYNGPLNVAWFGTGNNVQLGADTSRRVCHIRLESDKDRPELRDAFARPDLRGHVRANRGRLLSAALTVLRGWHVAGRPGEKLPAWGSYESWSAVVRQSVVWAGLEDPGETRLALQTEADRDAAAMAALITGLAKVDPHQVGRTSAEIIELAKADTAMRAAVEDLCGRLDSRSLGHRLKHFKRRIIGGWFIDRAGTDHQAARWAAFPANAFRRAGKPPPHTPQPPPGEAGGGEEGEFGEPARPDAEAAGRDARVSMERNGFTRRQNHPVSGDTEEGEL